MARNYPRRRKQLEEPVKLDVVSSFIERKYGEEVEVGAIQFTNGGKVLVEAMQVNNPYVEPKKSTIDIGYFDPSEDDVKDLYEAAEFDPLNNQDQWESMNLGEAIEDLVNLEGDRAHFRALKTSDKYEGSVQVVELKYDNDSDVVVLPNEGDLEFIDSLYGKLDRSGVPFANLGEEQEKRVQRNKEEFAQGSDYDATIEVGEDVHPRDVRAALGEAENYVLEEHSQEWAREIDESYVRLKEEAGIH